MVSVAQPEVVAWKDIPKRFAVHVVIGVFMFLVVGAAAVGLHYFVEWMTASGLDSWMIRVARWLEYFLYGADVLVFSVYIARATFHHLMMLVKRDVVI